MSENPKIEKKTVNHQFLFALLGSAGIKALRKTLMKLTPDPDLLLVSLNGVFSLGIGASIVS